MSTAVSPSGSAAPYNPNPNAASWRPPDPDVPPVIDDDKVNPRLLELFDAFKAGLKEVMRERGFTFGEYQLFREVITVLGPFSTGLFDSEVDPLIAQAAGATSGGTPWNPIGPFWVDGTPMLGEGSVVLPMRPDEPGTPLVVSGKVRSLDGSPLTGTDITIWSCAENGVYSNFPGDDQPDWNLRGRLLTDADGRYEFRTIKPVPYGSPMPPIVGSMYDGLGRSRYRPRHVHFIVRHPDLAGRDANLAGGTFVTQMYFEGDRYVEVDCGQAARPELVRPSVLHDDPSDYEARGLDRPFEAVEFDLTLATTTKRSDG
jgi:catechol 1,2-dioxygenase